MARVVVADDQPVVRIGFAAMIDAAPDLEVVGTAANGQELLDVVAAQRPDIAVVDIRMPVLDGIAATAQLSTRFPDTKVLILTTFDLDEYVFDALQAGASGFLLKDVTAERLAEGVRMVADGSMLLGPIVTRRLVADFTVRSTAPVAGLDKLTAREREVLLAVARGLSNAEIGAEMFIAEQTVKSHITELLRKLDRRDRVQLVIVAYESGLVRPGTKHSLASGPQNPHGGPTRPRAGEANRKCDSVGRRAQDLPADTLQFRHSLGWRMVVRPALSSATAPSA